MKRRPRLEKSAVVLFRMNQRVEVDFKTRSLVNNWDTKMKLFKETYRTFAILGISSSQNKFNKKVVLPMICYWIDNILNCIYLCRVVESFSEYMNSIFFTCITSSIVICFTITIFKWKNITTLIHTAEELVRQSK